MSGYREKIAERRRQLGLSQGDLADKLGLARATINRLEAGQTSLTVEQVQDIATALGVSLPWLLCLSDTSEEILEGLEPPAGAPRTTHRKGALKWDDPREAPGPSSQRREGKTALSIGSAPAELANEIAHLTSEVARAHATLQKAHARLKQLLEEPS